MGWTVPGHVLRRDRATTGVTEPLEDGTTAQKGQSYYWCDRTTGGWDRATTGVTEPP